MIRGLVYKEHQTLWHLANSKTPCKLEDTLQTRHKEWWYYTNSAPAYFRLTNSAPKQSLTICLLDGVTLYLCMCKVCGCRVCWCRVCKVPKWPVPFTNPWTTNFKALLFYTFRWNAVINIITWITMEKCKLSQHQSLYLRQRKKSWAKVNETISSWVVGESCSPRTILVVFSSALALDFCVGRLLDCLNKLPGFL